VRLFKSCITVLFLAAILVFVRYAVARDGARHVDLHKVYQQINSQYFDQELADLRVNWDDLNAEAGSGAMGITDFDEDTAIAIRVDRKWNNSESAIRKTLEHEACHVSVGTAEPGHGEKWKRCMKRFI
jgi:hypothetical protein